jgi:hypothetical protein
MTAYLTNAEIEIVVKDKFGGRKHERPVLSPKRGLQIHRLALNLLSLIF